MGRRLRLRPGPAGPMAERSLSLSGWWACESRRGRSGRGSGRYSGLSVVRGRLRGLSWGNRPHFGADQPRRPVGDDEQRVGLALDAMGRRLRSPRLPGVDVPGVDASMSPASMRWADVYVCMLADGVALRNRCPQGQADPRAAIAGGASGQRHDEQRVGLALDAMGRRLPGVDVPGVEDQGYFYVNAQLPLAASL